MATASDTFTERELDRIIEMAWEDRTPFEGHIISVWASRKGGHKSNAWKS